MVNGQCGEKFLKDTYTNSIRWNDAHAEIIERATGLSFLGDATTEYGESRHCHMTGKETKEESYWQNHTDLET